MGTNNAINSSLSSTVGSGSIVGSSLVYGKICEGRLTLTSGNPVTTTDVTAAATVYFTPYLGNFIDLYNGSTGWDRIPFTEISIAVPAVANKMYDVFVYNNSGTAALEALAWTNDSTRATALTTQDGVYVKSGDTTRRYLGSFRTLSASQTEDSKANRLVWNYYNRVIKALYVTDATASWTYTTATFRQARANAANQVTVVDGVSEDCIDISVTVDLANGIAGICNMALAIGLDSTTTPATGSIVANVGAPASPATNRLYMAARFNGYVGIGYHSLVWLEFSDATGTTTWISGSQSGLSGIWKC